MSDVFIDVDHAQIFKHGQKIGGDVFLQSRSGTGHQVVCTLSDGLGSGVKANVLANITAGMAHRMSFSPMNLVHSAKLIMDTLPVCKDRKISYSTFTIVDVRHPTAGNPIAQVVEYDNPSALHFRGSFRESWMRQPIALNRDGAFKQEVVNHSQIELVEGDRLIVFTDGVTQAGMGHSLPLGWRLQGVETFISRLIEENPTISSGELSKAVVRKACALDGLAARDDITCCVLFVRKPRRTLVVTGPPFTMDRDEALGKRINAFEGRRIVCGGTTAQIVARLLGKRISVDLSAWSPDVPPASRMEGIDLVTEGMLTLGKVAALLEQRVSPVSLPDNAAKRLLVLLLDSDQVEFVVGTKINEAHQDPSIPVEIGIRRTIVGRIRTALEKVYLKETSLEYV